MTGSDMGRRVTLTATDGFQLSAWRADPAGKPRGGVIVVQEIFGVNAHICSVAEAYAAEGFVAVAPAIFDRIERDFEVAYDPAEYARGLDLAKRLDREKTLLDLAGAAREAGRGGKVGIVGYCLGGALAWLASARLDGLSAAVGYYGGGIAAMIDLKPRAPTMLHFGEKDAHIPLEGVHKVAAAHPEVQVFTYPADHGFNRDVGKSYEPESAALAKARSVAFFAEHLAAS